VAIHYWGWYLQVKNNIIIKSSTSGYSYLAWNLQNSGTGEYFNTDYNQFYWPSQSVNIDWEDQGVLSLANIKGGSGDGLPQETNSGEGDPGLVDWDNGNFKISASGSAVVDGGTDMGSGNIASLTITGQTVYVPWDFGFGPDTDWSGIIPVIESRSRDVDGWDRGAYVYVAGESEQPADISGLTLH
jgi:hypothetical protein